ncbi:MAG: glycosyltransferase [Burkholderiaceae bacterium]
MVRPDQARASYVLVDPFSSHTSGVTRYCQLAGERLRQQADSITQITRQADESIEAFAKRLPRELARTARPGAIVEVPETLAAARHIDKRWLIHVRLHGSRDLGARLQGLPVDETAQTLEQELLDRAWMISAPSQAAVTAGNMSFRLPDGVVVYPNPAPPSETRRRQPDIDVLFLGRWQSLKGRDYVRALIKRLPDCRFALATAAQDLRLPRNAIALAADTPAKRAEALSRSKVVIIPSQFETASMVGLEALAAGCRIVCWSHLGLTEYAGNDLLYHAKPFSLDDLATKVESALKETRISNVDEAISRINCGFDMATNTLLRQTRPASIPPLSSPDHTNIRQTLTQEIKRMNRTDWTQRSRILQRKVRKLVRDPNQFWLDSTLRSTLTRPEAHAAVTRQVFNTASGLNIKPASRASRYPERQLVSRIKKTDFIKIDLPNKKANGWTTGLAHDSGDRERIAQLCANLDCFEDFSPTQTRNLSLFEYDDLIDQTDDSIIERIDRKNKEKIETFDFVFFVDTPAHLIRAFKACMPTGKTVLILTDRAPADLPLDPVSTDALIFDNRCAPSSPAPWRRSTPFLRAENLPATIRRVVQELGPKQPDMLLPLIGANDYDPELFGFDPNRFQGIIELGEMRAIKADCLDDYLRNMAPSIKRMLVLDSVYMRYRSLCEAVENGESASDLIRLALRDGMLFDVR